MDVEKLNTRDCIHSYLLSHETLHEEQVYL